MRLFILVFCTLFSLASSIAAALNVGDHAPDWILAKGNHQPISYYQDAQEQYSVLIFWATECPSCQELLPQLEKLRQKYTNTPVAFYALNTSEDGDSIHYMKEHNLKLTLLLNADDVARNYHVKQTPGIFLVNPDHTIEYIGNSASSQQLSEHIVHWLDQGLSEAAGR